MRLERDNSLEKFLLLTLDYELYGNGSGNVFRHIIEPTNKILDICKSHNVYLTIFFEVVEYWKLKEEWDKGNKMGYEENPTSVMIEQIQKAYSEGHDVQLHLHPQWVDAKWNERRWVVNNKEWRLGDFRKDNPSELYSLIKKGKETLEEIIKPIDSTYECRIIRAGGYNVQPSYEIVKVMKQLKIVADSSIVPGSVENGSLSCYDFTTVPTDKGIWECGENLENKGNNEIFELPIVTFPIVRFRKYLSWEKLRSIMQNRRSAKETFNAKTSKKDTKVGKWGRIQYFFGQEFQTWDFCLFSKSLHKKYLNKINQQRKRNFFVLVGHPKSFITGRGLTFLLNEAKNRYTFPTLSQIIRDV